MLKRIKEGTPVVNFNISGVTKKAIPASFLGLSFEVGDAYALASTNFQKVRINSICARSSRPAAGHVRGAASEHTEAQAACAPPPAPLSALPPEPSVALLLPPPKTCSRLLTQHGI